MCEFISFFVSVQHNKLVCGNPRSHSSAPVRSALDDWREAEWTEYGLTIRTTKDDDLNAYEATVLALCRTRSELCEYLSPSIDANGDTHYFYEDGYGLSRIRCTANPCGRESGLCSDICLRRCIMKATRV